MKARLLKILPLFLIAALVAGGVLAGLPGKADAAKKITYKVLIMNPGTSWDRMNPKVNNESPTVSITSINNAKGTFGIAAGEGITFDLVVDSKLKTKKVKIAGNKVKATYYKVKIPKKSYKAPVLRYLSPMGIVVTTVEMKSNAKGRLYVENGDVDIISVLKKKAKTKIGDGTVDPPGSLIIQMKTEVKVIVEETGKPFMKLKSKSYLTTGKSSIVVKGSKTALEGLRLPESDTSGLLTTPLVGVPLDLEAGTGTLVLTSGATKIKSGLGRLDHLSAQIRVLQITR